MVRVLLAGGGTVGHTAPMLATARALREYDPVNDPVNDPANDPANDPKFDSATEIVCVGTHRGPEQRLASQAGLELQLVPPVPFPRRPNADLLRLPCRLWTAVRAAQEIIDRFRPDVVCGFGGYVAVPAYLAARKRGVPLVIHEGNALPGIANKLGARITDNVATSFPDTRLPHANYIGMPVRREIADLDRSAARAHAREHFGLDPELPTLLVTGGSQGARRINTAVSSAGPHLAEAGIQVLHAAGRPDEVTWRPGPHAPPYVLVDFIDRMDLAYAAADAIICRAGANTVLEVAIVGVPAAFVPLPIGNGEQAVNAGAVVRGGGGVLIDDDGISAEWIRSAMIPMLLDPARLAAMSQAARDVVPADADRGLVRMIMKAAGE